MNKAKGIFIVCISMIYVLTSPSFVVGLNPEVEDKFEANNIVFYNPSNDGCSSDFNFAGNCGDDIVSTSQADKTIEVIEKYGELAMKLQMDYGTPWELVFSQMVMESSMDTCNNCVASAVRAKGLYNWMGMKHRAGKQIYSLSEPYASPNGSNWAQFSSIQNMMAGYFVDYMRNGIYDKAFEFTDPNNYDVKNFFFTIIKSYCPASDSCNHANYWKVVDQTMKKAHEVAARKGWPTSAELAKNKNIPIGGKYPVNGDLRGKILEEMGISPHTGNINCGQDFTSGSTNQGSSNSSGGGVAVADKGVLLDNHNTVTFYSAHGSENGGYAGKNATSSINGGKLADGQVAKDTRDKSLNFGDVIYIETTPDKSQEGSYAHGKYFIVADTGASYGSGFNIDVFHDVAKPSDNNPAPYGLGKNAKVYKVASGVTWEEYLSKYKTKNAASGSSDGSSSSSSKISVNATWSSGWITGGIDGYVKNSPFDRGYTPGDSSWQKDYSTNSPKGGVGPNKITLHNTEGIDDNDDDMIANSYGNNGYYPHFSVNLKRRKVYQHFPINKPSSAMGGGVGGFNNDTNGGIQIEIVGFSYPANKYSGSLQNLHKNWYLFDENLFKDEDWLYLAKLMVALSVETGIPLQTGVDWNNRDGAHMNASEFAGYVGVLGHMHNVNQVSGNHSDPGNVWSKLEKHFGGITAGLGSEQRQECGNTNKSYHGDFPYYSQVDPKWKGERYGIGTIGNNGCGPTSFAMMATALTGREYLPPDVVKIANQYNLCVTTRSGRGCGSSHGLPAALAPHYGLEFKDLGYRSSGVTIETINQYLSDGWMIWTCGGPGAPNKVFDGPHCIGIRALTSNGKWLIADSGNAEEYTRKEWDPAELYPHMRPFKAIRRGNV